MTNVLWPIVGGILIGFSATLLLLLTGRIAGISGILWRGLTDKVANKRIWRWFFLIGVLLGTYLFHVIAGKPAPIVNDNYLLAIIAGLFVGVGVKIGNGCTSGHGVCGIGRLSPRSLLATMTFMITAIVTVVVFKAMIAGAAL